MLCMVVRKSPKERRTLLNQGTKTDQKDKITAWRRYFLAHAKVDEECGLRYNRPVIKNIRRIGIFPKPAAAVKREKPV